MRHVFSFLADVELTVEEQVIAGIVVGVSIVEKVGITKQVFERVTVVYRPVEIKANGLMIKSLKVLAVSRGAQIIAVDVVPVKEHALIQIVGIAKVLVDAAHAIAVDCVWIEATAYALGLNHFTRRRVGEIKGISTRHEEITL